MASLKGKVIAVTGAASGIGKATAQVLHSRGASLSLVDLKDEDLRKTAEEISSQSSEGQKVVHRVVDVTSTEQVDSWIRDVMETFGKLDGAANVAGVGIMKATSIVDTTDKEWDFCMGVNATGVFKCVRAQLRVMEAGASIVNIASLAAMMGGRGMVPYTASKHATLGISRSAAKEAGPRNIRVNCVCPGFVDTVMLNKSSPEFHATEANLENFVPMKRMGKPEEIGTLIATLLGDDTTYVNGAVVTVDGGMAC